MPDPTPSKPESGSRALLGLLFILGLAGVLRFWNIGDRSLWLDEFITVHMSTGHGLANFDLPTNQWIDEPTDYITLDNAAPWQRIWTQAGGDTHPPLFYVLLRAWRGLGGEGDTGIRAFSAILSLGGILLLYIGISTQGHRTAALWACLIMAVAGVQIDYAQEARSYMLLQTALLGTGVAMLRIEHRGDNWTRIVAFGFCAATSALTHYLAIPLLGAMGVYALLRLRGRARVRTIGAMAIAGIVCITLWAPFAVVQARGFLDRIAFTESKIWLLSDWLSQIGRMPARLLITATSVPDGWFFLGLPLYLLPLLVWRRNGAILFWWMWLILGTAAIAGGDLIRQAHMLDIPRYPMSIGPGLFAICGLMFAHLPGWRASVLPAAIVVACAAAIPGAYSRPKGDWRELGRYLSENIGPGDLMVFQQIPNQGWRARCDLIGMQYYCPTMAVPIIFLDSPPSRDDLDRISRARNAWLFQSFATSDPDSVFAPVQRRTLLDLPRAGRLYRIEAQAPTTRQAP